MPKRSSNSSAGKSVLAIMLVALLGAGVLAAYVKMTPQAAHVTQDRPQSGPDVTVQSQATNRTEAPLTKQEGLLVPSVIQNDVKLDKPAGSPPDGVRPEVFLVNQSLSSLKIDGASALGIEVKDRVAAVSFNPGIEKGYGTIEEGYLIKALQMALGQFKDIDKFQVIVEGKTVDSLGNIDLSTPVEVIRPGQKPGSDDKKPIDPS
jgi:hypothetical protein